MPEDSARTSRRRFRLRSDLNLHGAAPGRVRPSLGEWGPAGVPTTRQKRRVRWLTPIVFLLVLIAVTALGWYFSRFFG